MKYISLLLLGQRGGGLPHSLPTLPGTRTRKVIFHLETGRGGGGAEVCEVTLHTGGGWLQVLENLGLTESCPVVELNPVQPGHVLVQPYQFFSRKTSQINSKKRI